MPVPPYARPAFHYRPIKAVVGLENQLPIFFGQFERAPYAKYCPNIESVDEMRGTGCCAYNYLIFLVGDATADEIKAQIEALAAFYASECDNADFDNDSNNAENSAQCA